MSEVWHWVLGAAIVVCDRSERVGAQSIFLFRCGPDRAGDLLSAVPNRGDLFSVSDVR